MKLQDSISPLEFLARFILQKKWYRADKTIRHNAFMPNQNGEVSVYRTKDLTCQQINEIGQLHVAEIQSKKLLGRAEIVTSSILKQNLKIEAAPEPHPRHTNIIGWPTDKSKHKMIAIELAAEAQLHLINNP